MSVGKRLGVPEWVYKVAIGDKLIPIPLWNETTQDQFKMPTPVEVLAIDTASQSQTNMLFLVRLRGGRTRWLDSAWFTKE